MADFMAGYGECILTSPTGIELTGYGYYLDRRAEAVLDELKVRALCLRTELSEVILVSCDLLGFTVEFSDTVRRAVAAELNIAFANILLACTHIHSGPALQSLRGLGNVEAGYPEKVTVAIKEAIKLAVADLQKAEFSYRLEAVEPIGFNRRNKNFEPIDQTLKTAVFKRNGERIYLLSYACHPVVLGTTKKISADWPGALIREIEEGGDRGIFFQGFCGDIDPVSNKNRWGKGTQDDLKLYGHLLYSRVRVAERYAQASQKVSLNAVEKRVSLPLTVAGRGGIEQEKQSWLKRHEGDSSRERFIEEWAQEAVKKCGEPGKNRYLDNVPIQAISIGDLQVLGVPGEVFCRYGLRLQERRPSLFTFGYTGGNIGYLPTSEAYQTADDYACYGAPKCYRLFPFSRDVEDTVLKKCNEVLTDLELLG